MTTTSVYDARLMSGFPPPPEQRVRLDQVYAEPHLTHWFMQHVRELSPTALVSRGSVSVAQLPPGSAPLDALRVHRASGGLWTLDETLQQEMLPGVRVGRSRELQRCRVTWPARVRQPGGRRGRTVLGAAAGRRRRDGR